MEILCELSGLKEKVDYLPKGFDTLLFKNFDKEGKTTVYISHRLSSCKFCDKIAVFDHHTIAEYGTHEELVKQEEGIYAKMFGAQAQYYV